METSTKILVGGVVAAAIAVILLSRQRSNATTAQAQPAPLPSNAGAPSFPVPIQTPVPSPLTPPPVPASTDVISRSPDPPEKATVGPPGFIATFSGFTIASVDGFITANGPVPRGTLLANIDTQLNTPTSTGGGFGMAPVVWVSPEGDRLAYVYKDFLSQTEGLHDGDLIIAHFGPAPSSGGGFSFPGLIAL